MKEQPEFSDRYKLLWQTTGSGQIGEVRNYTTTRKGYRKIPVMLDDALMKQIGMRYIVSSWDCRGPVITVSVGFIVLPLEFREAGIWHEVGHIHFEHPLKDKTTDQTQLKMARVKAIRENRVLPIEEEADRFAVSHVGKESLIRFLTYLLQSRPTGGQSGLND